MAENNLNEVVDPDIYIWLDEAIETATSNRELKTRLQQIVKGRLQTFIDPDKCIDYITDLTTQKILLIVSNKFGHYIVPFIHDVPQIDTVYVYCGNRSAAESWSKPYPKVREIFITKKSLLRQIHNNVGAGNDDEDLSVSVFQNQKEQCSLQKLTEQCTKFLWYQAILTVLLHMAKHFNSKDDMIKASRQHYHDNDCQKAKIDEFDQTYTPEKVFWWYTDASFVYRLLNSALRTQNIDVIFKFRFFINDLHKQIQRLYQEYLTNHRGEQLKFYRGQQMSMDEVEVLKNSIDGLISMNSFLSTTRLQDVAEFYIDADGQCKTESSLQNVIFIIDVCDIDEETAPFAFIKRFSCNEDEDEVLFTISAIFKVESVEKKNNTWHVNLKLSKQNQNQHHKDFSKYMIKQLGKEPGPTALGWFLYRRGGKEGFDDAIHYAENILNQPSMDDKDIAGAYNLLGLIYKDLKKLEQSIDCYNKALDVCIRSDSINTAKIFGIHYNASLAYLAMDNEELAEGHRRKAAALLTNSSDNNNSLFIAMTESLNAKLQTAQGNLEEAFHSLEVVLAEKKKILPLKHPSLVSTFNDMGIVQERMGNNEQALKYFKQALDMCCDCLTTNHIDLAEYHTNMGHVYYKCQKYELALEQFEAAYKIMTNYRLNDTKHFIIVMRCLSDTNDQLFPRRPE